MPESSPLVDRLRALYPQDIVALKRLAWRNPWNGQGPIQQRQRVLWTLPEEPDRILSILLTFDVGYHASGWWKNSQYDAAHHLSMVVIKRGERIPEKALETPELAEFQAVSRAFFNDDVRYGWVEPPASAFDTYRTAPPSRHTYHLRIFVDRKTGQAIQPVGEITALVPFSDGSSPEKIFR